jgi:SulP family sulfate permease
MVPVALAYAGLAGVPPAVGLVTAFAALAAYAVLGTSRHLKVTTSSTMAIMSASVVAPLAGGDSVRFVALSAALAITVGVILVAAGLLRLGFLSDFLAKPVVTGFVIGLAITIIVGQLPKLLGVPSVSGTVFDQIVGIIKELPETQLLTFAVGVGAIVIIVVARRFLPALPAPLLALALGIAASWAFDLAARGVSVVGEIQTGLPLPSIPRISAGDVPFLVAGAGGIVFLALGESLGAARSFAVRHGYDIDADQELIAIGGANVSAGLFGGFTVDASMSQSATAESAGARSQLSSLVTSVMLLATVLFLAPIFTPLPYAVLGAVVIMGTISLLDVTELRRYWAWRRWDLLLAVVALVGVVTPSHRRTGGRPAHRPLGRAALLLQLERRPRRGHRPRHDGRSQSARGHPGHGLDR